MPFNLRNFEDETKAKMGVVECVNHGLVEPYQVLFEKTGNIIFVRHIYYKSRIIIHLIFKVNLLYNSSLQC